jgi:hypothetical protein
MAQISNTIAGEKRVKEGRRAFLPLTMGQEKGSPGRIESAPPIKAPFAPRAFSVPLMSFM